MRRFSFFPYLVLALTLILVTVFVFLTSTTSTSKYKLDNKLSGTSDVYYEIALKTVLKQFVAEYSATSSDVKKTEMIQSTLSALLNMRVPADKKNIHLELALALQKMKQGIATNPQDVLEGYAQIKELLDQTPWLQL